MVSTAQTTGSAGPGEDTTDVPRGSKAAPGLSLVATPIGNLSDITLRALDILRTASVIACEDTRVTGRLMSRYGIRVPLIPYHEHNAAKMRPQLLARMQAGEAVALVSDAGTPLVSDPGYKLVRECAELGIAVTAIPGASAPLAALILSGLPTDRFLFAGFLPPKSGARRGILSELAGVRTTLVFFETAPRLTDTLADMAEVLGPREAAVARELTKLFEEVRRGTLPGLLSHYTEAGPPKGEIVLVVGPPLEQTAEEAAQDMDAALREALTRLSVRDAAAEVAAQTGLPRKQVYARALELAKDRE